MRAGQLSLLSCRAVYRFAVVWPKVAPGIDWSPLVCTLEAGHDGVHVDATKASSLHSEPPSWSEETA